MPHCRNGEGRRGGWGEEHEEEGSSEERNQEWEGGEGKGLERRRNIN